MAKKITTLTVENNDGYLICTTVIEAIARLRPALEQQMATFKNGDEPVIFTVKIEKKLTQKQIDTLPEFGEF